MLALAFLLLIGVSLVVDGLGIQLHLDKGYIYAAMAFSVLVEAINIIAKRRKDASRGKLAHAAAGRGWPQAPVSQSKL